MGAECSAKAWNRSELSEGVQMSALMTEVQQSSEFTVY